MIKRPELLSCIILKNPYYYSFRIIVGIIKNNKDKEKETTPWQNIGRASRQRLKLKIIAFKSDTSSIFQQEYWTNELGILELKIPTYKINENINYFKIYETSHHPGLSLILGNYIPHAIPENFKIVISDFDKTLVETKYSNPQEVYRSLSSPLSDFPTIKEGLRLFKSYIEQNAIPFIVSAGPHFYERPIKDWLYQQGILNNEVFLKDYKSILGPFSGQLTLKDITYHGFYKLQSILKILSMTHIPRELALIGDGFEADPYIYLTIEKLLTKSTDPWHLWNEIKKLPQFTQTNRQKTSLLDLFFTIYEMKSKLSFTPIVKIHIRLHSKIKIKEKSPIIEYFTEN